MINAFDRNDRQEACPRWIPTFDPTFPLDADNPVKLVLAVLVSLYGRDYIALLQTASFSSELQSDIEDMHFWAIRPTYWRLECRGGDEYWMTYEPGRFRQTIARRAGVTRCTESSRTVYNQRPADERRVH
jgi:hypothetical protein